MGKGRTEVKHIRAFPEDLELLKKQGVVINADFIHSCITEKDTHILNVEMENDFPNFMYGYEASNREIYQYLKSHPEAGQFLFQTYTANQIYIKNLCNPKNPMYLPELFENLKNVFESKEIHKTIDSMRSEESRLKNNLRALQIESKEFQGSHEKLLHQVESEKIQLQELQRMNANIREDKGMKLIQNHYNDVIEFAKAALKIDDLSNIETWAQIATGTRNLDKALLNNLKMILENAQNDLYYLRTQEFISEIELDKARSDLKKGIDEAYNDLAYLKNSRFKTMIPTFRRLFDNETQRLNQAYKGNRMALGDVLDDRGKEEALLQKMENVILKIEGD